FCHWASAVLGAGMDGFETEAERALRLAATGMSEERFVRSRVALERRWEAARAAAVRASSQRALVQRCVFCVEVFQAARKGQRFCSDRCRYAFRDRCEPLPATVCAECGDVFVPLRAHGKYCS